MNRVVTTVLAAPLLAASALMGAGSAGAQPLPPPCHYTLSPPQVVQGDGGSRVTATVSFDACGAPFQPAVSVVCVHLAGPSSQGSCAQARGPATAQVFFEPYEPGATYIASGRGCGKVFEDAIEPNCQILGPINLPL
ncbi:Uncharacterised protein [Mycolicibacterium phlei]|jgi:hypothetical protein|uniref:Subtilisin inhibitor domain-containing protein n=1 Tax=Mycolicibacterium phlei DSM 43239 = CCUG 21000 TaxID=1226750 RepID=A0A5N5V4B8_MYCPH|nr:hypothetical protein [Mycolicibacterium phlei]VEG10881.1 Uncharacterised protein [Mycobacteroides chelonae]AMO62780.1 hypothetical protein MPHLCCUG_03992 [Mycolicibacterium phlei]EID08989.1 hypothetical protein MPHLEI_26327 [Mycolicibacterium phlei RIVM601174]KAB7755897.1 hypothetical protein MPHL21000_12700 [Mycolicibacterium phlei DSM 43239 = CCUG 21000]KXW65852.1 hypothetical protein MPHL43239_09250 [Mycolicibacterium phlei DSM 43239 = CCUG 21000]